MNIGDKIQCVHFESKNGPRTLVEAKIIRIIDENEKYYRVKAYFKDYVKYCTVKINEDGHGMFANW